MPERHRRIAGLLLAIVAIGATVYWFWPHATTVESAAVQSALSGGDTAGFQRALAPRPFDFPTDHGPHPDFRTEWWYVTGNLSDAGGRRFGYQLTLFRIGLAPAPPPEDSAWRTNQIYMAHFALTDVTGQKHHAFERFSRGAIGLAGAQAVPFRVWLEDWSLSGAENDAFPMRLQARQAGIALDLTLITAKTIVLQGDHGLSQKSAEPGNASYYYSYTRLPTQGTVSLGESAFQVNGASWLDREWSTSALGPEQSGWDWFALQLDDGRDIMFYRLRRKDGGIDPHSKGALVAADGRARVLGRDEVELRPLGEWRSPASGDRYPAGWRLRLPAERLELTVTPKLADQELRLTVRYWEGAVSVEGRSGDRPIGGQGYLEMTRYETPISP
ncbi:MAG TPA: lipocalin-like domain-containing protein [Candidatus Competibacter sp.]|nr:carotenoid 1,2-hydratase [Candidatus Competibacteraceae bacterium]HRE54811.1 lipocalin-like domain-containing protein [Candidatus Competibacter sp.]HUM94062.1 lipocalin-like domain-containing protein [Candidatus Competibacter sp.]